MGKETKSLMIQVSYAASVGFAMVLAIFGSLLLGSWLDRKFGTGNKLAVIFLVIGAAAGLYNVFAIIRKNFPDEESAAPQRYLKREPHPKRPPAKKN